MLWSLVVVLAQLREYCTWCLDAKAVIGLDSGNIDLCVTEYEMSSTSNT